VIKNENEQMSLTEPRFRERERRARDEAMKAREAFLLAGWQGDRMDMTSKLEWEPDRLLRMMLKKDAEMRQEDANKAEPSIASWRRVASSSSSLEMK
jgi:hypothetical protein